MSKEEYIDDIVKHLDVCEDISLLDFILRLLVKGF